jgi:hypothetical protein
MVEKLSGKLALTHGGETTAKISINAWLGIYLEHYHQRMVEKLPGRS